MKVLTENELTEMRDKVLSMKREFDAIPKGNPTRAAKANVVKEAMLVYNQAVDDANSAAAAAHNKGTTATETSTKVSANPPKPTIQSHAMPSQSAPAAPAAPSPAPTPTPAPAPAPRPAFPSESSRSAAQPPDQPSAPPVPQTPKKTPTPSEPLIDGVREGKNDPSLDSDMIHQLQMRLGGLEERMRIVDHALVNTASAGEIESLHEKIGTPGAMLERLAVVEGIVRDLSATATDIPTILQHTKDAQSDTERLALFLGGEEILAKGALEGPNLLSRFGELEEKCIEGLHKVNSIMDAHETQMKEVLSAIASLSQTIDCSFDRFANSIGHISNFEPTFVVGEYLAFLQRLLDQVLQQFDTLPEPFTAEAKEVRRQGKGLAYQYQLIFGLAMKAHMARNAAREMEIAQAMVEPPSTAGANCQNILPPTSTISTTPAVVAKTEDTSSNPNLDSTPNSNLPDNPTHNQPTRHYEHLPPLLESEEEGEIPGRNDIHGLIEKQEPLPAEAHDLHRVPEEPEGIPAEARPSRNLRKRRNEGDDGDGNGPSAAKVLKPNSKGRKGSRQRRKAGRVRIPLTTEQKAASRRRTRKAYEQKKLKKASDDAVDRAIAELYASTINSVASETVVPGSEPGERPDEVIQGRCFPLSAHTSNGNSTMINEAQSTRGPHCPEARPDERWGEEWRCTSLPEPGWTDVHWPTRSRCNMLQDQLRSLVGQLRGDLPGSDVDLQANNFLPLPLWASRYSYRHPFLPCIDLDFYGWDSKAFIKGLETAKDTIQGGGTQKFKRLVELLFDTAEGNHRLLDIVTGDDQMLQRWEKTIGGLLDSDSKGEDTLESLQDFTRGIQFGVSILRAKEAWCLPYEQSKPIEFMEGLLAEVRQERRNMRYCLEWLESGISIYYAGITAVLEGSLPLRFQKICYLIDSIREFTFGWQNHRRRYMSGICAFQLGWMERPRKVQDLVFQIINPSVS